MEIEHLALESGLDLIGVAPVGPAPDWSRYKEWTNRGYAADMSYLTRPDAVLKRQDPRHILPETLSVVVSAVPYGHGIASQPGPFEGSVSRYAWGEDYHRWLLARLNTLVSKISRTAKVVVKSRCYVDTGPVLERSWAQSAGLGWIGKNTCFINPQLGSYVFLGIVLINLDVTSPVRKNFPTCGSCTKCTDACPTGALVAPGVLDAKRCISYLTIENRGAIPVEMRSAVGNRVFGCDVCQDVCPWNRKSLSEEPAAHSPYQKLDLREVLEMNSDEFRQRYRSTSIWRATPEGLARNAAVVLGNQQDEQVKDYVRKIIHLHPSLMVREHLRWAVDQ